MGRVNVHVNLRHMHMLCHVVRWVGWGVLTFMLTCVTCTCYVTSGFRLSGIIVSYKLAESQKPPGLPCIYPKWPRVQNICNTTVIL